MTQFVFKGNYREYRGYVFANGKPVTINDAATDRLLRAHPDFEVCNLEIAKGKPAALKKRGRPAKGK